MNWKKVKHELPPLEREILLGFFSQDGSFCWDKVEVIKDYEVKGEGGLPWYYVVGVGFNQFDPEEYWLEIVPPLPKIEGKND